METLNDDEQTEVLKKWWKQNGNSLVIGVLLGGSALGGYKYWQQWTLDQTHKASVLYQDVIKGFTQGPLPVALFAADNIIKDYPRTPYAPLAALMQARIYQEGGKFDEVIQKLEWAVAHAKDEGVQHTARLRLARAYLDHGDLDRAGKLAGTKVTGGFEGHYQELIGDIAVARKDPASAQLAYQAALMGGQDKDDSGRNAPDPDYARVLQMKLDDLGATPEPGKP